MSHSFLRLAAIFVIGASITTAMSTLASAQPQDRVIAEQLDRSNQLAAERGKVPSHLALTGTLRAGETTDVQVHTCSDVEYEAVGVCDHDCDDIDLHARNASGESEDSDVLPDDVPILYFSPAASGLTTISVEMVSCESSCDWGVQLYVDDPVATDGASGPGNGDAPTWLSDWDIYLGTYRNSHGDTTILRHENQLLVLLPFSRQQHGTTGVLRPTGSTHVFRLESNGSRADAERVRFAVNDAGDVTAVFVAGQESRRVE